jgi:thiamine pyrophosphokinase
MTLFAVHLGGRLVVTPRLRQQIAGARHIAADSGIAHCETLGLTPELWIGDFDSSAASLRRKFESVERIEYPSDKAKTDGELAVDAALSLGATRIVMVGGLGGARTDHAFGNLTLMMAEAERGRDIMMTSGNEEAWPLRPGRQVLDLPDGTIFSIIAFETLKGLSLEGARWPLDNMDVTFGSSLTLSNEVTGALFASIRTGRAAILARTPVS